MDSYYAPNIKEEFLNENENAATVLANANANNIIVKNEPILDEEMTLVTIKHETPFEAPFAQNVSIKNENQLETQVAAVDRFVIYELETPKNDGGKETNNIDQLERPTFRLPSKRNDPFINNQSHSSLKRNDPFINNTQLPYNLNDPISRDKHNFETTPFPQLNTAISTTSAGANCTTNNSTPILLNTQLRKRNKIVLPVSSLDKRTRYNIEGTLKRSPNSEIQKSSQVSSGVSSATPTTSSKKIINHLMKHKQVQRKQEIRKNEEKLKLDLIPAESSQFNSSDLVEITPDGSPPISKSTHMKNNTTKVEDISGQDLPIIIESPTTNLPLIVDSPTTLIASQHKIVEPPELTTSSKKLTAPVPATTCELRVKCLCRLTDDNRKTTDNSEIVEFFKEMYEKTRILTKKQQRLVKMTLLQTISEAENDVEQGKCCCF